MKRYILLLLILLLAISPISAQRLRREGSFQMKELTPVTNLTTEDGIHIYPFDDLQYTVGSESPNSAVVAENFNANQFTFLSWIRLSYVPGDGHGNRYLLDNQGTGAGQNRIALFIDSAGLLTFDVDDKDSTQHLVSYDITGWLPGSWHQIVARLDFKNDEIELYTDGASRDSTPDNALSSDSIDAIEATTHIGSNTSASGSINGVMTVLLESRSWSDSEISGNNASAAGTPFVVSPNTILMGAYSF